MEEDEMIKKTPILLSLFTIISLLVGCSVPNNPTPADTEVPPTQAAALEPSLSDEVQAPDIASTQTKEIAAEITWPEVTGPDPSYRVAAFYYPWYFNLEVDGRWIHWDQGGYTPPLDIASDFYPVLGAYSVSDPTVLAQHFAWLREAGVGVIISSWWGRNEASNQSLQLMFDIANHYGIKIAFHIEPYEGRSAGRLISDIQYIYDKYGDLPAFFWTTETSCFSLDDRPKGLFLMWATVVPDSNSAIVDPDYWQASIDKIHDRHPGAIILTDQNDPAWVTESHFDGSYNYGVLDTDQVGYLWALDLPSCAWYVPGINPGFAARRIGYESWVDTPRMDGGTYENRWEQMFAVGIEPKLVTITTFNEWHEGTQIEPAAPSVTAPSGFNYLDYGTLPPDGYLTLTRQWSEKFLVYEWPSSTSLRIRMRTTSDWTDLILTQGAIWYDPRLVSTSGGVTEASMLDGRFALQQPINLAESSHMVEAIFEIQVREVDDENLIVFEIERGGLGTTWVELYQFHEDEWTMVDSFSWGGHSGGDRNIASYQVEKAVIFAIND
jgi:glycoprotein endo-alpha-1,2-mannosidase